MGILISKVRITNFRSIEDIELPLSTTNVLIGANNCGKSNFLKAINIALGQIKTVSSDDIYVASDEILNDSKCAIIDIMFQPTDNTNIISQRFSDFWVSVFTEEWLSTGDTNGDYVGIRTIIQYDVLRNDYVIIRKQIKDWGDSISSAKVSNNKYFTKDMNTYISSYYMDAHRDVVDDIKDRKSYFGRATSKINLTQDNISTIEGQLNSVNSVIIESIPALKQTTEKISKIATTVGAVNSSIEIQPLARKIGDLHKGMDVVYKDGNSAALSVSQHGMGTRSWISFLTLGAYVDWERQNLFEDDPDSESYIMLTMEEPEAHLHPQAQQKLYSQLCDFYGQKIISSHSTSIVAQAKLDNLIHFKKIDGKTKAYPFDSRLFSEEEKNRIKREIISSHGELLFSKAIILCEGITEQQALPIYFREEFGIEPEFCGISIIGIGGQHYKTFLSLINNFKINWFIFSDGENSTIHTVDNAIKAVFHKSVQDCSNVIIIDKNDDYEMHLINSGYKEEIIKAICEIENNEDFVKNYIDKNNNSIFKSKKSNLPKCEKCNQYIYEEVRRDYSGDDGFLRGLYDCCTSKNAKAKYAIGVAQKIVSIEDKNKRIPPKIKSLFQAMGSIIEKKGEN